MIVIIIALDNCESLNIIIVGSSFIGMEAAAMFSEEYGGFFGWNVVKFIN